MANELKHDLTALGTTLQRTDWEDGNIHVFDSQATGDIPYASSPTQISRLGIGVGVLYASGGVPTWSAAPTLTSPTINGTIATTGLTLPAFTAGGDIAVGANEIVGTFWRLKNYGSQLGLRNVADDAFADLYLRIGWFYGNLVFSANGLGIRANNVDNHYVKLEARDNGAGLVEIGRLQAAADPYFQLGPTAGAFRVSLAKVIEIDLDGSLETVSLGVADSGGAGFMLLRIPNT